MKIEKNYKLLFILIFFFGILGLAKSSRASSYTYNCTGTDDQNGINTAISAGSYGATVTIGPGACTFTGPVVMSNGVKLIFAGPSSTTITGTPSTFFVFGSSINGGDYRLSGFKITGSSTSVGDIMVDGSWNNLVIDNIEVANSSGRFLWIGGQSGMFNVVLYGFPDFNQKMLIQNIKFTTTTGGQFLRAYGRSHFAWAEDEGLGTDDFIVIENCTLNYSTFPNGGMIDSEAGAKFVFRYNDVTNGWFTYHDFANVRYRGSRAFEVYNNKFTCNESACQGLWPISWRGGTGLIYNNTSTGYWIELFTEIFRESQSSSFGQCPTSGTTTMCRDAFMHCVGGTNSGKPCYPGWCPGGQCGTGVGGGGYTGCTSNSDCKTIAGVDDYCIQIDGGGTGNYPCRDQNGRGKEDPATGIQSQMPLYWWGNYYNGSLYNISLNTDYIQPNRDYCNHDPSTDCGSKGSWSYVRLTCPDPRIDPLHQGSCDSAKIGTIGYSLTGNSGDTTPPAAPSGLSVQ